MTNSWMNEDGEPIMDGAAWRFEQQLDMESQADYMADHFYDDEDYPDECPACGGTDCDSECDEGEALVDTYDGMEDQWLDGSYEE